MRARRAALIAAVCALLVTLASGCVEVTTTITRRGFIYRTFRVLVSETHAESVRIEIAKRFDREWEISETAENQQTAFTITSSRSRTSVDDYPGATLDMQSTSSEQSYTYTEDLDLARFLPVPSVRKDFANTEIGFRVKMPGKVTSYSPTFRGTQESDDTVLFTWKVSDLDRDEPRSVRVTSSARRLDRGFLIALEVIVFGGAALSILTSSRVVRFFRRVFLDDDGGSDGIIGEPG